MNTKHDTTARGPGRPALPPDQVRGAGDGARVSVRLDARDAATLRALANALGTTDADAMRRAMHAMAARRVRS